MQGLKTLIRADSSSQLGQGHIRRCLILARHYAQVSFACLALPGSLIDEIPHPVFELAGPSIYELINLIKREGFEFLIIDHYEIRADDEKLIKLETGVKIMSLDDELNPHHCDILLNVNAFARPEDYTGLVPRHCALRCGFSHALIGEDFYAEREISREKNFDLLICLGATDPRNLTPSLALAPPPGQKIALATTRANANLKMLEKLAEAHAHITLFTDPPSLARLMNESKQLIITASSLVNEALLLRAKFKALCLAKNQERLALWLRARGYEVEFL